MLTLGGNLNVYHFDQVPGHFRENFILGGYRKPQISPIQCLQSIFSRTNETLNFWTHFLPACYFLFQLVSVMTSQGLRNEYYWALYLYLFSSCVYPLVSSLAHVLNAMSLRARHICFFFDYASISLFSLGVAIAYRSYCFPASLHDSAFHDWYIYIAAVNSIGSLIMMCETRFIPRKSLRIFPFALPYIFDTIPIMYRSYYCELDGGCSSPGLVPHVRQFTYTGLATFFYASHLPERIWPGMFDIIGHSHQLFHVFAVIATYDQMTAVISDMDERKSFLIASHNTLDAHFSLGIFLCVAAINLVTIYVFILRMDKIGLKEMLKIRNGKKE